MGIEMKTTFKKLLVAGLLIATAAYSSMSQAIASVSVRNRVLVVVAELDSRGAPELSALYSALEELTQVTVQGVLGDKYDRIDILTGGRATFPEFKRVVKEFSRDPNVLAIDVIMSVHGAPGKLAFQDLTWKTTDMEAAMLSVSSRQDTIDKMRMKKKLRMIYNTSCFGASHRQNFLNMGFKVANGSIGVNANSEVEFVPALMAWRSGIGFKDSFNASNNDFALALADGPLQIAGRAAGNSLAKVNSRKLFSGAVTMKINSDAR